MTQHDLIAADAAILDIHPITPIIGARIRGLRLSADLPEAVVDAIKSAVARHKVVFFRGQDHLDDVAQEAFAARLGKLAPHPTQKIQAGTSSVLEVDSAHGGRADEWHTDVTFVPAYPAYSVLRGVTIPDVGGDTIWANTAAAYDAMPTPMKQLADSLRAVHGNAYDYAAHRPKATEAEAKHYREVFSLTAFQTEHPVVRVHPETGERSLVLGSFMQRFTGLSKSETQKLYDISQAYVTAPETTLRRQWQADNVAIWDNRTTHHVTFNDYGEAHRVVRRVTIGGDVPVGVDGRTSRAF